MIIKQVDLDYAYDFKPTWKWLENLTTYLKTRNMTLDRLVENGPGGGNPMLVFNVPADFDYSRDFAEFQDKVHNIVAE